MLGRGTLALGLTITQTPLLGERGDSVIDRRTFVTRVAFGLFVAPLAAHAQPTGRVYRIGYLSSSSSDLEPLQAGLSGVSQPAAVDIRRQAVRVGRRPHVLLD